MEKPESSPIKNPEQLKREELNSLADSAVKIFNSGKFDEVLEILDKLQVVLGLNEIVTLEKARDIMGEKLFLGPEAIKKTFEIELKPEQIPPIPFSRQELNRAKQLGQFLILRIDSDKDGNPLTAKRMTEIAHVRLINEGRERILSGVLYREDFYSKHTPHFSWALTTTSFVPASLSKDFISQTRELIVYLKNEVFKTQEVPDVYMRAIEQFESNEASILEESDFLLSLLRPGKSEKEVFEKEVTVLNKIFSLDINWLLRPTFAELIYDYLVYFFNNNARFMRDGEYFVMSKHENRFVSVRVGDYIEDEKFDYNLFTYNPTRLTLPVFSRRASI